MHIVAIDTENGLAHCGMALYLFFFFCLFVFFFFFKQKTAYEIYQCDWSSDVCSSDLLAVPIHSW